jgi:hypothetical protein
MNYGTNYDNLCLKLKIWDLDRKIDFSKKQTVSVALTNQQTHLIKNTVVIDVDPSEQEITVGYSLVTDYGISKQVIHSLSQADKNALPLWWLSMVVYLPWLTT